MSAVASSPVVERPVFKTTGQDSDQMCVLIRELWPIIERHIARLDKESAETEECGGLATLAREWSNVSGKTETACIRRLYAYRHETVCITAHVADELLMSVGEYIEDYDDQLTYFPGGHAAAQEQAELYSEDQSELGLRRYAEKVWQEAKELIEAELVRRWEASGRCN